MKKFIFAVKDLAVGEFMDVFAAPAIGAAVRSFGDEVGREGAPFNMHPHDYELWFLGAMDTESGVLESELNRVARGLDYVSSH